MSRFKFLGSKGQMVKPDVYVVDKAVNEVLYESVSDDSEPIPAGSIVVLVDGSDSEAKLAVKTTPWSEGISLGSGGGGGGDVAWADITGKPTTFAPVIGTTATTAMAGNTAIPAAASTAPAALATAAAVGTGITFARADHVHARPTGAQVLATGYAIGTAGAIAAADSINAALGKLEARIVALETA